MEIGKLLIPFQGVWWKYFGSVTYLSEDWKIGQTSHIEYAKKARAAATHNSDAF